jgi:hypothetical protein
VGARRYIREKFTMLPTCGGATGTAYRTQGGAHHITCHARLVCSCHTPSAAHPAQASEPGSAAAAGPAFGSLQLLLILHFAVVGSLLHCHCDTLPPPSICCRCVGPMVVLLLSAALWGQLATWMSRWLVLMQ